MDGEGPRTSDARMFADDYERALRAFLSEGGEKWLQEAHDLGRRAIGAGLGILDLVTMHEAASGLEEPHAASEFLREALSPFEMTHRGFAEANAELRELNDSLQRLVDERTEDLRERKRLSEALNEINDLMRSRQGSEQIMCDVLAKGAETVGAESGSVARADGVEWVVRYVWGHKPDIVGLRFSSDQNPATRLAVEQGRPIVAEHAQWAASMEDLAPGGSTIVAPIVVRDRAIAVLHVNHQGGSHRFDQAEVDFIEKVASSLSLALRDVMSFEAEHRVAEVLQEALLSLPEQLSGVEFGHAYHSATETARVGGDFYDLFELSQHHIGITVGDVAGKGLDAAVLTSLAKNTIRAHAFERGKTPGQILALTNEVVFRATSHESFVTLFFGILDGRDGRLVYASAGHTSAGLVRADESFSKLSATGPLLGAFGGLDFDQAEARLDCDDVLFLYTDGLTETRREGEFYGEERLFSLLQSRVHESVDALVQAVVDDVLAFGGGGLSDDLAVLAVKRQERSSESPRQQKLEL